MPQLGWKASVTATAAAAVQWQLPKGTISNAQDVFRGTKKQARKFYQQNNESLTQKAAWEKQQSHHTTAQTTSAWRGHGSIDNWLIRGDRISKGGKTPPLLLSFGGSRFATTTELNQNAPKQTNRRC